jgi:hypothetical protein
MPMQLMSFGLLLTIPMAVTAGMAVLVWICYAVCGNNASDALQSLSQLNPDDDNYLILFAVDNVTTVQLFPARDSPI